MGRKLTKEEFINREPDLLSGKYEFIGNYVNAHTKTVFKHNKCGYEWMITPSHFHTGERCPKCAGNIKLTKEEFCEREEDILSGEYEVVGEYVSTHTKTLFKHNACGYEWMIEPKKFYQKRRCPKCAIRNQLNKLSLTKEEFCKREEDIQSGEYTMRGKYLNNHTKTLFKHNECNYEWEIRPAKFHAGNRCPKCGGTMQLTKKTFCDREEDIVSGEYLIIGAYKDTQTKTLFKHSICGYEWMITPSHFHQGRRCPRCNQSRGERVISKLLEDLDVVFKSQKRFNTCRYKKPLPFDFYVNDSFLVEYDGEQHFTEVDYFGGNQGFSLRQLRDNIKTQWAKDNGIPLVRIPYTEFDNIEQIIRDSVDKYCNESDGSKVII